MPPHHKVTQMEMIESLSFVIGVNIRKVEVLRVFKPGDYVVYGGSGACRVESIGKPKLNVADASKMYYTLCPLYSSEIIYAPVDTGVFMRPVLSRVEAEQLIARIPAMEMVDFEDHSATELKEHYNAAFRSHNCEDLLCLVKGVYAKSISFTGRGKKLGQVDQQYWKRAEDLLHGEFAIALGIPRETVGDYIAATLGEAHS